MMINTKPRPCGSCNLSRGLHTHDCADRTTMRLPVIAPVPATIPDDVYQAVIAARQRAGERRTRSNRAPVWAMVSIVSGSVLMAIGWLANDPVARYVWEIIR